MMSFNSYKPLIFGPIRPCSEILNVLAADLHAIDESILNAVLAPIDDLNDDKEKLTELAVLCRDKTYAHPQWSILAGRIRMIYIYRNTPSTFAEYTKVMKPVLGKEYYAFCTKYADRFEGMINRDLDWNYDIFAVETLLRSYLTKVNDKKGQTYLAETPQYKNMRIAAYLWFEDSQKSDILNICFSKIKQTYLDISEGRISPASPTQMNAGMKRPQLASCFLLGIDDNIESLSKSWKDSAIISMTNGGIGMVFDSIRHSEIGNSGWSNGITPWIKIENEVLNTVDQGGGKRKGSGTMYLQDWHIDILTFIDLKEPFGKEELRAKDLFYGLMISDLFMNRVKNDEMWTLICPAKTDGLEKTYGKEFEKRYLALEERIAKNKNLSIEEQIEQDTYLSSTKQIPARELWTHILKSQIAVGMPFTIYKDAVNRKSNQRNLGTIRLSNLCTEIMEFVDKDNIASCNLASIALSKFVKKHVNNQPYFDFEELGRVTRRTIRNLGQTINRNYYPADVPQIKYCNMRNRPLGIGVQDLAGCFALMDLCWESEEARALNEKIARVMYYHGMCENVTMAEEFGAYETFKGSPASKGLFQFDLWNLEALEKDRGNEDISFDDIIEIASKIASLDGYHVSDEELARLKLSRTDLMSQDCLHECLRTPSHLRGVHSDELLTAMIDKLVREIHNIFIKVPCNEFNWEALRKRMITSGLYFSLLFAQMPTASSAQILGNNESIECYTQFLYARTVLSGQFAIVVDHLVRDLEEIELWDTNMLKHLLATQGSIQGFPTDGMSDPTRVRFEYLLKKYKTAYEHSQRTFANMYIDRAKYQCQSTSNNVFMKTPTLKSLNSYHFHMWHSGAKTGSYYLRQMPKTSPLNFSLSTIGVGKRKDSDRVNMEEEDGECLVCQS